MAMRVISVCNALGSSSNYCAGRFLFGPPFGVCCRGEQISEDDRWSHAGSVGGRKSLVSQFRCVGAEEEAEQREAPILIYNGPAKRRIQVWVRDSIY
jgi:hypothetical protein